MTKSLNKQHHVQKIKCLRKKVVKEVLVDNKEKTTVSV